VTTTTTRHGLVEGTVYGDLIERHFPNAKTINYEDEVAMFTDMHFGKISAAFASTPAPQIAEKLSPNLLAFDKSFGDLDDAFAIKRGDADFLNYLNTWIRYYENSGWLEGQRNYWFKDMKWLKDL